MCGMPAFRNSKLWKVRKGEKMAIKYCVWDVGQVVYPFSLDYLDEWAFSKTVDKADFQNKGGVKTFDYNPYMLGKEDDAAFCEKLCLEYNIPFEKQTVFEISQALHQGVGKFFDETLETMKILSQKGIQNCILSNALPMLEDTAAHLVAKNYLFTSYQLGLLKPNPEIYEKVRQSLGCGFEEIIFVDDKERNVLSAKNLGIHGIVFNPKTIKNDCELII